MVRSLYNFQADFDVVFSIPLERSNFLQASHPVHISPIQWPCLAGIGPGFPPAHCGNEAHGLVDHERSTLQFSHRWGFCGLGLGLVVP